MGNPSLAVDANNVYFFNHATGTVLQSALSTLGNTSPQVIFTNVNGSTTSPIQAITIDATRVYYMSGANALVGSALIGGGSPITYPLGSGVRMGGSPMIAVDATNVYTYLYTPNSGEGVGYTPKTGGTIDTYWSTSVVYQNLFDNGTYLIWPQCPSGNNCEITLYDVATSSTAYLAMNEEAPNALTASATNVYWGQQSSPYAIRTSPVSGSTGPTNFVASLSAAVGAMSVDPMTGTVYWILGSNGGPLQKASQVGQVPVTIMSNGTNVMGTPCFDASNVYYMMTDPESDVQVWRSPK